MPRVLVRSASFTTSITVQAQICTSSPRWIEKSTMSSGGSGALNV